MNKAIARASQIGLAAACVVYGFDWIVIVFSLLSVHRLPALERPFYLAMRIYWPEQAALGGTWIPSPVVRKA